MTKGDVFANESELDQVLDTEGTSADDLDSGGFVTEECKAHLLVTDVKKEAKEGKVPCIVLMMQVQAADKDGQKGKFCSHRINLKKAVYSGEGKDKKMIDMEPLSDGAKKSLLKFALGLELIQASDIGKKDLRIPWSQANGRSCMSHLRHGSEYEKDGKMVKGSVGVQFGEVFPMNDERCADWPRDTESANPTNLNDF